MTRRLATLAALLLAVPAAAAAQQYADAGTFTLEGWTYEPLYAPGSWNADALIDRPVAGTEGNEIGKVEDLVFDDQGRLVALIAEVGGLWDIGDTHVSVPWNKVEIPRIGAVGIPVSEATVDQFSIFDSSGLPGTRIRDAIVSDIAREPLRGGIWRASEMLGDYVRIQDTDTAWLNFGYVTDLVVRDSRIRATVVRTDPSVEGGIYAFPPFIDTLATDGPTAWAPQSATYDMPILRGDASALPSFEVDRVGEL